MTSHILVCFSLLSLASGVQRLIRDLKGIYPVIIIILVHSQKSYIDTATATGYPTHDLPRPSEYTNSSGTTRRAWDSSRDVSYSKRPHPIEINVHELHTMQGGASSKSLADVGRDDSVITARVVEKKSDDTIA